MAGNVRTCDWLGWCWLWLWLYDTAVVFAITAKVRRVSQRWLGRVPVGFFLLRGRLLPLGRGNLAFNVESDAICAWHPEASGIAADLADASEGMYRYEEEVVMADLARVACLLQRRVSIRYGEESESGAISSYLAGPGSALSAVAARQ
jgi:hypothetical protein